MEQAEFGEVRSSISDPLDPEDETLIWSAGSFLDPLLIVRRLRTEVSLDLIARQNSLNDDNEADFILLYNIVEFIFLSTMYYHCIQQNIL